MLGRTISDPHGVENENSLREPLRGMELIDTDTTLMPEKMRTQTRGKFENMTGIFSTLGRWQNRRGTAHGKRQRSTRRIRQLCARHF